jgi:hypothetical protein
MLGLAYQIRIAPEISAVLGGPAYLDGKARTQYAAPGPHQIAVEMHVISGTGPSQGRLSSCSSSRGLEAKARSWVGAGW